MNEQRLIDLETKVSYQEENLRILDEVVTRQQKQLEQLEEACRHLAERVARVGQDVFKGTADDEVPPHY